MTGYNVYFSKGKEIDLILVVEDGLDIAPPDPAGDHYTFSCRDDIKGKALARMAGEICHRIGGLNEQV